MSRDIAGSFSPREPGATKVRSGFFIAVVGPSGAGKDTLLSLAARELGHDDRLLFARRIVTRAAVVAVEDHDVMAEDDFEESRRNGAFCLDWRAHGLSYGLPSELASELAAGRSVAANVSRRVLDEAVERFDRVAVIEITAPRSVLVERIAARGRESQSEIEDRVSRAIELRVPAAVRSFYRIRNDGTPAAGSARFIEILEEILAR